jgi:type VI secretion system protein VasG
MIGAIARLQLERIVTRIRENHGIPFVYDDAVVSLIVNRCTELESGGRMIDAILTNTLLPRISQEILTRMMAGNPVSSVAVTAADGEFRYTVD